MSPHPTVEPPVDDTFRSMVERLSRQSVDKHFDAYDDIDWEAPEHRIDAHDPRWQLHDVDPLGRTEWYRSQAADTRARIGLQRLATMMRVGWEFENILQRGLLAFAFRLPNGTPEFRYLHHEIIEESQHSLAFQEFVNRTGMRVRGLPRLIKRIAELFVLPLNRLFPELFFVFVLGGEDPVDHFQRRHLAGEHGHPLARRIMRLHVTEEARHLSFARHYLKRHVPELGWFRRQILAVAAPVLLGAMARLMLWPPLGLVRAHRVPRVALRDATTSPYARALLRDSVAKPRRLFTELGLVNPFTRRVWDLMGIGEDEGG